MVKDNVKFLCELLSDICLVLLGLVDNDVLFKVFDVVVGGNGVSVYVDLLYVIFI